MEYVLLSTIIGMVSMLLVLVIGWYGYYRKKSNVFYIKAYHEGWDAHKNETRLAMKEKFPDTFKTINREIP